MKAFAIGAALLLLALPAKPCANFSGSSGTKFNGAWTSGASIRGVWELRRALQRDLTKDGVALEAELRGATNFNDRSDYSVALMYLGRSQEAIALLQTLEKEQPGKYFVAANLGTAYELAGDNEDAAHWIAEGIHRNPESHEGTEWLHLRILEAKIARQTDPDYFKKHSVLDIMPEPMTPDSVLGKEQLHPAEVEEAIQHQLSERMQFVKPPDAAVASLLFDYAAIEAGTRTLESAEQILHMAVNYGYPPEKVNPLLKVYHGRIAMRKFSQYAFYSFLGACAVGLLFLLYKKGIFVISSRDLKRA